ncbi:MAG: lipoprotein releasing system, ATP-binding protein [Gammaproteobacteria bacterium RIFCSPHIGHO2_12_FULL_38_11]|nr:MAG: lipoprotein releasing system, ATP-binding protein [Gammaproteobacteria bacterium RIFCSPHIGHO2_12_FULL_38_11]
MSNPVIQCHALGKTYHDGELCVNVFDNINLSIMPSETVAIIGASGAGKSTLLQLMGGLDKPTNGFVLINGKKIVELKERERCELRNHNLGFIYQFHHLLPEFSALENVCMPLMIADLPQKIIDEKAEKILTQVGLKNRMHHRIGELSGGERQRIAIARALVNNPSCVLADEPTGNLDHNTADIVFNLMLKLNREHQTSFVIVTHNEALAKRCDRVLVLGNGVLT